MASTSGADHNLYTEFKKSIETSIVQRIRTVDEINMYVLFLSICSLTFLFNNVGKSGGTKRHTGNMASMSGADDNLYIEFKKLIKPSIAQKFGHIRK